MRCKWCKLNNPLYIKYHDEEWGVLQSDDHYLFEMLILEMFASGLSWECVLNKREAFRKAYDDFDAKMVSEYDENKINELLADSSIIRNRRKIAASINDARVFIKIQKEYGCFYDYLRTFVKDVIYENDKTTSEISDELSNDLKRRGMRSLGSITVYSYLQAVGLINSHEKDCFLYKKDDRQV